jgi:hypothetical protein
METKLILVTNNSLNINEIKMPCLVFATYVSLHFIDIFFGSSNVNVSVAIEKQICVHQDKSGYSRKCLLPALSGNSMQLHNSPHETLYHLPLSRDYM